MLATSKLIEAVNQRYPDLTEINGADLMQFIQEYSDRQYEEYKKLKANRELHFGKYKGYTIKELCLTTKGKDYMIWLMSQTWFSEDKYPDLYDDIKSCGLKKKSSKIQANPLTELLPLVRT